METINVQGQPIPVAVLGERRLRNHYWMGRFHSWYYCQFARGMDGTLYRTAPCDRPPYPEETTFKTEWLLDTDVIFSQDDHITSDI